MKKISKICLSVIATLLLCGSTSHSQESGENDIERGIWLYRHENYEEALVVLRRVREENPGSSLAAYYLGITYKQLQDYKNARPHLKAAVTLTPRIKGALIELIDLLYRLDDMEEAKKWIKVAEEEDIRPAQTYFLKGLVFLREGDTEAAIECLEKAKELDDTLTNVVDYQIGVAHLKAERFKEAESAFKEIVLDDPTTDLALFSDEYLDAIEERRELARPLKLQVGYYFQYDDNVVLKPFDEATAGGIADKADTRQVCNFRGRYNLKPTDYFGTEFGYAFSYAKETDLGFYDTISHNFSVQPSFYIEDFMLSFPVNFDYLTVNDKRYLYDFAFGNLTNYRFAKNMMAQAGFIYKEKDYFWLPAVTDENRDGREYTGHLAYYYFFAKNKGFFNLKYAVNLNDAKGPNWKYLGNKVTAVSLIPVIDRVKLTLAGEFFLEKFLRRNSVFDTRRLDAIFLLSSLLTVEIFKGAELQFSYTFMDNRSNIGTYAYNRNIYSVGVEYKF